MLIIVWNKFSNKKFQNTPETGNASVNSKHQHPPGNFLKVVKFPAPGRKIFAKLRPRGKKIDKNPATGDNFVDLQDNFVMIVKPFAFSIQMAPSVRTIEEPTTTSLYDIPLFYY